MRVYFYCCPYNGPEKAAYQHGIICLAEGLLELGVEFCGNADYWRLSPSSTECLIRHRPECGPDDCDVVVIMDDWFSYGLPMPVDLFHRGRTYTTVYLDSAAWRNHAWMPEFRQFDLILRCHYNRRCHYPSNMRPWAFGLSTRILREVSGTRTFEKRKPKILFNARCPHPLRTHVRDKVMPLMGSFFDVDSSVDSRPVTSDGEYHNMQYEQTGGRHYPLYYERLGEAMASACFGGSDPSYWWRHVQRRRFRYWAPDVLVRWPRPIVSWDSWRLWESMAAGCVPFHVDFDRYGIEMPVMPRNRLHYMGVDLDNVHATIDTLRHDDNLLARISRAATEWAITHYSPRAVAARFLNSVSARSDTYAETGETR